MANPLATELDVLTGFDDDLAGEATRISNQIRGLLTGIHSTLELAIGPQVNIPRSCPASADQPVSANLAAAG